MINLNKIEGTDIYEFSIDGEIDKEGIENIYKLFQLKSKNSEKIKLLGKIHDIDGFESFKAFGETFKMKAAAITSIDKYAVLSNRHWMETLMPIANFVTPGIPIKYFDLDEREEAITWLKKGKERSVSEADYLSKMNIQKIKDTNIFKFTVDGKIDEGGMTALYNILKDKSQQCKINLLGYYKDFDGFESFKAFSEGVKVDMASFGNLEKFAIVTDKKWVKMMAEFESKVLPGITLKGFSENEEAEAIQWLKEK
ncbi:SpoIIAA-like protein [Mariniflexile fucanivorans]|uniref:SpoIIAA-like protein n=1 Tax=Mariniflexile fucanivorans TaxID=264023 RepID=A0A4R1RFW1_9FLAO|nr:STAS/SEC14 domain-containing protein [Mariniflexile fucanivorans]TCL64864.1 SpoIIAA-like protein [Mariniflexile fucanivorans]